MKRVLFILFLAAATMASAQQFAKTGIINLARVSQQFKESGAKTIEDMRAAIQKDLDGMKDEIRQLNDQRTAAVSAGDNAKVQSLDAAIQAKTAAFNDYGKKKQDELNSAAALLRNDQAFQKLLPQEIEQAAISKGFALILNASNPAIIWYGPDADITDDVIQRLQADLTK